MISFDTLAYSKRLQAVGVTSEQAEVQAETLKEIIDNNLVTKNHLKELQANLKREMADTKVEMIKWVAGMLLVQIGLFWAIVRSLIH